MYFVRAYKSSNFIKRFVFEYKLSVESVSDKLINMLSIIQLRQCILLTLVGLIFFHAPYTVIYKYQLWLMNPRDKIVL